MPKIEPDADKPIADIEIDTRSRGPVICDECEEENESVRLMEDGAIVCPACHSDLPEFEQLSSAFMAVRPLKVKDLGRRGYEVVDE